MQNEKYNFENKYNKDFFLPEILNTFLQFNIRAWEKLNQPACARS